MEVIRDGDRAAVRADPDQFTGSVWRTVFIAPPDREHLSGLRFDYAPGARSFWHVHECEQAIVAVHGRGVVAWEGMTRPFLLTPGDWWHVEPGVAHWHGATPSTAFAHLAVTAGGGITWLSEVSEDEYHRQGSDPPPT
jgi:quercetin dioxygenase-like cupin family protein